MNRLWLVVLLLYSFCMQAETYEKKVIVVAPQLVLAANTDQEIIDKLNQTNETSFNRAVKRVEQQLPKYLTLLPNITPYSGDDFYQNHDAQGTFFLRKIAPSTQRDLILFGHLEYDAEQQLVTAQIDGFDGKNNTDWLVLTSPFNISSIAYLEEIYVQLIFDLLNEPSKTGLKLRNDQNLMAGNNEN